MSQAYRVCAGVVECESESESPLNILDSIHGVMGIIHKQFLAQGWKLKENEDTSLVKKIEGIDVEVDLKKKVFRAHIEAEEKVWVTDRGGSHKDALNSGRDRLKSNLEKTIMQRDQKILEEINSIISEGEHQALRQAAQQQGSIESESNVGGAYRLTVKV